MRVNQVTKKKAKHGGNRVGAGRRHGSKNKVTKAIKAHVAELLRSGKELPLDFLLCVMREPEPIYQDGDSIVQFKLRYMVWAVRLRGDRNMIPAESTTVLH